MKVEGHTKIYLGSGFNVSKLRNMRISEKLIFPFNNGFWVLFTTPSASHCKTFSLANCVSPHSSHCPVLIYPPSSCRPDAAEECKAEEAAPTEAVEADAPVSKDD